MSLKEMLDTELPLNRKERFFTGTVFPMIVCKDNFKYIQILLSLLGIPNTINLNSNPSESNILFFTEYSLVESLIKADKQRFQEIPESKDTPDIVMLIKATTKILIALEAKMYDVPTVDKLNEQMGAQQKIIKSIEKSLGIDETYHYLLLPEKLAQQSNRVKHPIVTWEALQDAYEPVCQDDYFFELLRISLEKYDTLASSGTGFGLNCEERMLGQQILKRFQDSNLDKNSMGRDGGLKGNQLEKDIATGRWRTFSYETSKKKPDELNRNWFLIEEFINRVKHL